MTKRHFKSVLAGLTASLMLAISGLCGVAPANAENFKTHLLVSPASQTLGKLEPGKTYSGEFNVRNIGTEQFTFKVYAAPYYEQNEQGDPTYTVSNNYTYLSEWITFDTTTGSLEPQGTKTVKYTVKIPTNARGGAQNAAIMVESEDSVDNTKTVSASTRIAMILFSQIDGETNMCGKIVDKEIPSLLLNPPISAWGRVENCGNIDLNVKYVMSVYPLFSNEEIYTNEEQPKVLATLPETRRYTSLDWEDTPSFGIFKVKLDITYNGNTETIEKLVIVCPLWLIVLVIVFIGAVVFWLVSRNRNRKKANNNDKEL